MLGKPVRLFFSYSHKDEVLRKELESHLDILRRQGVIESWHDRMIGAGDEWARQIDGNLRNADIILLLISSDFLASDYCYDIELQLAMERHEAGEAIVIPVILRTVNWQGAPFGKLQAFPKDGKPVVNWASHDEAFDNVARGIQTAAIQLAEKRKQREQYLEQIREQYTQKVLEVKASIPKGREIPIGARDTLDELREELGLPIEEAKEIEAVALAPDKRIEQFRKTLEKYCEKGYPFDEQTMKDLENRRRDLGLKPEDVEPFFIQLKAQYQDLLNQMFATYQNAFINVIKKYGYPINEAGAVELQDIQNRLGLSDGLISQFQEVIIENLQKTSVEDDLSSDSNIDYRYLQALLKAERWRDADQETGRIMLKVAGREKEANLRMEDVENFPCTDLSTIDQLWVTYSNGRFGFSVQKSIWEQFGQDSEAFSSYVGWLTNGEWIDYDNLSFTLEAPIGHLPRCGAWVISFLTSRIASCSR